MTPSWFAITGPVHGSLGAALLALLALAVWLDWRRERESCGSALAFAALLQIAAIAAGGLQRHGYQHYLETFVLAHSPGIDRWLLAKQLIALLCVALTWVALASNWRGHRVSDAARSARLDSVKRAAARLALASAAAVFLVGAVCGAALDHLSAVH
ncbi:MAG TPA: hypothetical protein PLI95_25555 [Polyangiaceae bacterium]|nr:hypothetical protein [Polyangiaceae bacterium]